MSWATARGQRADRGGLVDDHEDPAVAGGFLDEGAELCFVLREGSVQEFLAGVVEGDGVVGDLSDVDADEHVDGVVAWEHESFRCWCG